MNIVTTENIRKAQWQMEHWLREMIEAGNIPMLMVSVSQVQNGEANVKIHLPPNASEEMVIDFLRGLLMKLEVEPRSLIIEP